MSYRSRIPALLAAGVLGLVPACSDSGSKPQDSTKDSTKTDAAAKRTPTPAPFEAGANPLVPPVPQGPGSRPTEKITDFPSFKIETVKPGSGPAIEFGQKGKFHYVGTFPNGKQFDSSIDSGEPLECALTSSAPNGVIKGWVLGLEGMKVGEKRRLIVPPELAYGKMGRGGVPPDATLVFDIELMSLTDAPASQPSSASGGAKK